MMRRRPLLALDRPCSFDAVDGDRASIANLCVSTPPATGSHSAEPVLSEVNSSALTIVHNSLFWTRKLVRPLCLRSPSSSIESKPVLDPHRKVVATTPEIRA